MEIKPQENIVKHYQHKRTLLWIICAAVILISGIVIGAGGTMLLVKHRVIWIGHPFKDAAAITKEISKKYDLNEQQAKQVEDILNRAFEKKQLQRDERDKQREQEAQILIAEMNEVLNRQQFERWNRDFQELREKFKKPAKK
jgi:polyhydroxyalkanoate synthesis regulator phasin